ncbi:MAG: RHS repeat-associated core domain-containing protein [Anaerosomatales bacterium]|nr:RHS repeat-associated core domain-containing protein [Anaerosomatales bacterium]
MRTARTPGLHCLSKRYYDPTTAEFLAKDPAKADGEESAYQYCAGDPVGKVDPSGEAWWKARFLALKSYVVLRVVWDVDPVTTCLYSHVGCHSGPTPGTTGVPVTWRIRVALFRQYVLDYALYTIDGRCAGHLARVKSGWASYQTFFENGTFREARSSALKKRIDRDKAWLRSWHRIWVW